MRCPHCKLEIPIGQQFCGGCGKRVTVGFDHIQDSVLSDAADRRAQLAEKILLNVIGGLIVLWVGVKLYNDYYLTTDFPASKDISVSFTAPKPKIRAENRLDLGVKADSLEMPRVGTVGAQGMSWRREPFRTRLLREECSSEEADAVRAAIERALAYIAKNQHSDGSWYVGRNEGGSASHDGWGRTGVSGLALLALMGDGHTWIAVPDERGKMVAGKYAGIVKKGVNYLTASQVLKGQDVGLVGPKKGHFMYNQGFAAAALSEAYALSGDPYVGRAAQKAVNYIISAQQKSGGWDYWEKPSVRADTSVTCCQLMALYAAHAAGIKVPGQVFEGGLRWIDSVTDPKTFNVGYDKRWELKEENQRFGTTAMGLALQLYLGRSPSTESVRRQSKRLLAFKLPDYDRKWKKSQKAAALDYYYIYHGSMAFHRLGGEDWKKWNKAAVKTLTASQIRRGTASGTWPLYDPHSKLGGRIFSTSTAVLTLQVYYRYP